MEMLALFLDVVVISNKSHRILKSMSFIFCQGTWTKGGRKAISYLALARIFELLGRLHEALENYKNSVSSFNEVRNLLKGKDHWKVCS